MSMRTPSTGQFKTERQAKLANVIITLAAAIRGLQPSGGYSHLGNVR
jgi:hypothetical protein